jgi:hypothetical protein
MGFRSLSLFLCAVLLGVVPPKCVDALQMCDAPQVTTGTAFPAFFLPFTIKPGRTLQITALNFQLPASGPLDIYFLNRAYTSTDVSTGPTGWTLKFSGTGGSTLTTYALNSALTLSPGRYTFALNSTQRINYYGPTVTNVTSNADIETCTGRIGAAVEDSCASTSPAWGSSFTMPRWFKGCIIYTITATTTTTGVPTTGVPTTGVPTTGIPTTGTTAPPTTTAVPTTTAPPTTAVSTTAVPGNSSAGVGTPPGADAESSGTGGELLPWWIIVAAVAGLCCCLVLIAAACFFLRRRRDRQDAYEGQAEMFETQVNTPQTGLQTPAYGDGQYASLSLASSPGMSGGEDTYQRFDYAALAGTGGSAAFNRQAEQDSKKLSLDPSRLKVDPAVIGRGAFGVVYKGTYAGETVGKLL